MAREAPQHVTERKSIYEWAKAFCGDPHSHKQRGQMFLNFLIQEGMKPTDRVLELGCGALSQGAPLIRWLGAGNYIGIEPAGWTVEAALAEHPDLEGFEPEFLWVTDFDASPSIGQPFAFVIAHSVLSHVAHWQLPQALMNVRKVVDEGAVWLASIRLDQFNSLSPSWSYPDVNTFRVETVMTLAWHAGWLVERMEEYEQRLHAVAPNDFHEILRLTAIPTPAEMNELRLAEEEREARDRELVRLAREEYVRREEEHLERLAEQAGVELL